MCAIRIPRWQRLEAVRTLGEQRGEKRWGRDILASPKCEIIILSKPGCALLASDAKGGPGGSTRKGGSFVHRKEGRFHNNIHLGTDRGCWEWSDLNSIPGTPPSSPRFQTFRSPDKARGAPHASGFVLCLILADRAWNKNIKECWLAAVIHDSKKKPTDFEVHVQSSSF